MNTRKAVKKIVALGIGVSMVGATILGAAAADLGQFPKMFIDADGKYNGLFVYGAVASSDDVAGLTDLFGAVQLQAFKKVWVETGVTETTFSAEDGAFLATGSDMLLNGNSLADATDEMDDSDLPDLLKSGTVEDNDVEKEDYDYDQMLYFADSEINFDTPADSDRGYLPVVKLDFAGNEAFTYAVEFDTSVVMGSDEQDSDDNYYGLQDSEKIVMLGQTFTFKSGMGNDSDITLYRSSVFEKLGVGESKDVTMPSGEEYTVELVAIDSEAANGAEVTIMVDGDVETLEEGEQAEIGGVEVRIDTIQINTVGDEFGSVTLYLGADEIILDMTDGSIDINDETLDGVEFSADADGLEDIQTLEFTFTPSEFDTEDAEMDELMVGESFVDPLFGAIKYQFVGSTAADLMESDDVIVLDGGSDTFAFNFVDTDGNEVSVDLLESFEDGANITLFSSDHVIHPSVFDESLLDAVVEDNVFIISDNGETDEDELTTFYYVKSINYDVDDDESYVKFENWNTGDTVEVYQGEELGDSGYEIDIADGVFNLSDAPGLDHVRTDNQGIVTFDVNDTIETSGSFVDAEISIVFEEAGDADFEGTPDTETFTITSNSDDEFEIDATGWTSGLKTDNDMSYYMSEIGTYGVWNNEDKDLLTLYVPKADVEYNVWIGPTAGAGESSGGSGAGYWKQESVPIPPSYTVKDTQVANPKAQNMIVVGGPCANTVAAALLQSSPSNCGAGFVEGTAKVKLFEAEDGMATGKIALLVAGYDAADTRRATTMLNDPVQVAKLSGKEVEISGTQSTTPTILVVK